ncbi:MAG: heme exporter protein B [Marivirga sp.]|jgi:heme exporter protein B
MLHQIKTFLGKEILLEWRNKNAFNTILLYLICTVFISYLSFNVKSGGLQTTTWNALYWIIIVFANISGVAKSFLQEGEGKILYYYTLCSPQVILTSKLLFNTLLSLIIASIGFLAYGVIFGNPVQNSVYFFFTIILTCIGFSSVLTLVSGIVSKANNSTTLMAVLSFPLLLPTLLVAIGVSKNAIDGIDTSLMNPKLLTLLSIDTIVIATAFLLFPFIWRN